MNPSLMEREIVFQQAKVTEKQRPYLVGFVEDIKWKAMLTGIVIGFCVSAISFFIGWVLV
jgi:multisubunit Na+/H+ antiporter MnhC subunit